MKYQVGDRVAVYQSGKRWTGTIKGTGFGILFSPDISSLSFEVHPKQIRKLIRSKRRHVWIAYIRGVIVKTFSYEPVSKHTYDEIVEFIEVKKK